MADSQDQFACDACARRYRRKPELIGRSVKCACGHLMTVSAPSVVVPESDEDELYDVVADAEPIRPRVTVPAASASTHAVSMPTAAAATAPARAPLGYVSKQVARNESAVEQYFPDRTKDLHLPLAFIAIGTAVNVGVMMFDRSRSVSPISLPFALGIVFAVMIVNAAIMLGVVFLVAKERGITMGPTLTAMLKLCGISIGPGAIGAFVGLLLSGIPFVGAVTGWIVGFVLYFAAIGALFDWDESDTWRVVIAVFFAKLLVFVGFFFFMR